MAIVFFDPKKENGLLSTWSDHEIVYDDIKFPTAEHFIVYEKARLLHLQSEMENVLKSSQPHVANRIGRSIGRNIEDKKLWEKNAERIVMQALQLKMDQHTDVFHFVRKLPRDIMIGFASKYDKVWGIQMDYSDPDVRHTRKWRGRNLLGKLWMDVKRELKE